MRYSEVFYSVSGEGKTCGIPTLYVRLFGCPFQCPAFPCDSEFSWNKKLNLYKEEDVSVIVDDIVSKLPQNTFRGWKYNPIHLSFTGGEPLTKPNQKNIVSILKEIRSRDIGLTDVTIETNASIMLSDDLIRVLKRYNTFMSMSPKLFHVSGERDAIYADVIKQYSKLFSSQIKVVLNNTTDAWTEFHNYMYMFLDHSEVWIMPLGATASSQESDDTRAIVEKALSYGLNISPRLHATLWDDEVGR